MTLLESILLGLLILAVMFWIRDQMRAARVRRREAERRLAQLAISRADLAEHAATLQSGKQAIKRDTEYNQSAILKELQQPLE